MRFFSTPFLLHEAGQGTPVPVSGFEQQDGCALVYAGEGMKNDVTIVQAAVQQNGRAIQNAGEVMKNDVTI